MAYRPTGLSPKTFQRLELGAGMFVVGMETDGITPDTTAQEFGEKLQAAKAAGKVLGGTAGGGTFVATPEVRPVELDDLTYPVIGSTLFDSWEVKLTTTVKEITKENIIRALATGEQDTTTGAIKINSTLLPEHYIPAFGWAGYLADGSLIYIELQNALNIVGLTMTFASKSEGSIPVEFRGHQGDLENMQYAPCEIYMFAPPVPVTDPDA